MYADINADSLGVFERRLAVFTTTMNDLRTSVKIHTSRMSEKRVLFDENHSTKSIQFQARLKRYKISKLFAVRYVICGVVVDVIIA